MVEIEIEEMMQSLILEYVSLNTLNYTHILP